MINDILSMVGNMVAYVFMIGPIGLFLRIKEGKMSLEKIVEDFEEERRTVLPAQRAERGILPTESLPQRRRNP